MKRLVSSLLLFGLVIVLSACNFGNTAGLHKEWAAMLDELEVRSGEFLFPSGTGDGMTDVVSYHYDFAADEAGMVTIQSVEMDAYVQFVVRDGEDKEDFGTLVDMMNDPVEFEAEDFLIAYGKDSVTEEVFAIIDDGKRLYQLFVMGIQLEEAEPFLTDFVAQLKRSDEGVELYREGREMLMDEASIFALGADTPTRLELAVSQETADLMLDFDREDGLSLVFRVTTRDISSDFDDNEYDIESVTFDHKPIDKLTKKADATLMFLPDMKYRFEKDGLFYEFHVEEVDDDFRDELVFDYVKRLRK